MKEKFVNQAVVQGYVFDHTLMKRTTKDDNREFINGTINIATDETATNIVPVTFIFVAPTYKNGNANRTYGVLEQLINSGRKFVDCGEEATKIKVTGSVGVNDFLGRDGNMVAAKRVVGSFCDIITDIAEPAATFEVDMLVNATRMKEVNEGDDYLEVEGYCFDFRGDIVPVTFSVENKKGIAYFENLDISKNEPLFTKVWGAIISTIVKKETVVESDWGEPQVTVSSRSFTAWNITGMKTYEDEFDEETTITKKELEAAEQRRVEHVAAEKVRAEEYRKSKNGNAGFPETSKKKSESPTASANYEF